MGKSGIYINNTSEYLTPEAITHFNIMVIPLNTVILSFKLTVGRISITDCEMTSNEAIAHFKTNNNVITEYLYLYLQSFKFAELGSTSSIGTAVNSKMVKAMSLLMPDEKTLFQFHSIVKSLFNQIKSNSSQSRTLATIRDTLLPRLMSGEIGVGGE